MFPHVYAMPSVPLRVTREKGNQAVGEAFKYPSHLSTTQEIKKKSIGLHQAKLARSTNLDSLIAAKYRAAKTLLGRTLWLLKYWTGITVLSLVTNLAFLPHPPHAHLVLGSDGGLCSVLFYSLFLSLPPHGFPHPKHWYKPFWWGAYSIKLWL